MELIMKDQGRGILAKFEMAGMASERGEGRAQGRGVKKDMMMMDGCQAGRDGKWKPEEEEGVKLQKGTRKVRSVVIEPSQQCIPLAPLIAHWQLTELRCSETNA